jgi:serine/threonine protein kinase
MASPLPVAPAPPAPPHVSPTATLSRQRVPVVARTQPTRPPEELLDLSFPSRTEALPVPLPRPDPGAPRKAGLRSNVEWYGPYLLLRRVAVGGMAELFMAKQGGVSGFEKVVAIKRLFPHLVRDHELVEMFVHEAKLVAGLNHPNIVQIYSLGRIGDSYHIAMEYVHGRDLRAIRMRAVERGLRLPLDIVVLIGRTVAGALAYAHHRVDERGRPLHIVHRDVSPQNILVSYEGDVKLTDFGIARAATRTTTTMHGTLRGKLAYMSPEQAMGEPEPRSDVFSLGVVLYELLSGQRPLQGDSQVAILEAIQRCRIQPLRELNPRVPERLEQVIMKALSRDPDQRYQDASNLRRALDHCLGERQPASAKELARLMDVLFDGSEQGLPGGPPESDESGAPELEVDFEQTPAGLLVGLRGQTPIPRSGETVEELLERIRPTRRR